MSFDFDIGNNYDVRLRSSAIVDAATVIVPDVHHNPEVQVYFDFLRSTTLNPLRPDELLDRTKTNEPLMNAVLGNILHFMSVVTGDFDSLKSSFPEITSLSPEDLTNTTTSRAFNSVSAIAKQNFINKFLNQILTDVQVTRSRTNEGTATISLRTIRLARNFGCAYADINILFNPDVKSKFDQLISPDVYVYIFGRGRLYPTLIYPMFSGLTTAISYEDNNGFDSISVQASDITKLLRLNWYNFNPGIADLRIFTTSGPDGPVLDNTGLVGGIHPFMGMSAKDILETLVTGTLTKSVDPSGVVRYVPKKNFENKTSVTVYGISNFKILSENAKGAQIYNIENNKVLQSFEDLYTSTKLDDLVRFPRLVVWGQTSDVNPYIEYFAPVAQSWDSEHKRRIDTIKEIADRTYSEFYSDAAGNLHFHPMRVGINFLNKTAIIVGKGAALKVADLSSPAIGILNDDNIENYSSTTSLDSPLDALVDVPPPYQWVNIISREEITSSSFTLSDAELATVVGVTGQFPYGTTDATLPGGLATIYPSNNPEHRDATMKKLGNLRDYTSTSNTEEHQLAQEAQLDDEANAINEIYSSPEEQMFLRFGNRRRDLQNPLLNTTRNLLKIAEMMYKLANKDVLSASVTILFRPELELCRPVFVPQRKEVYYIDSISHNYSVGGLCITTVGLTFGRTDTEEYTDLINNLIDDYGKIIGKEGSEIRADNVAQDAKKAKETQKPKKAVTNPVGGGGGPEKIISNEEADCREAINQALNDDRSAPACCAKFNLPFPYKPKSKPL